MSNDRTGPEGRGDRVSRKGGEGGAGGAYKGARRGLRPLPYRLQLSRWIFLAIAYVSIGLGLIGIFLPGLPTTPFLLLAVWAGKRGSDTLHDWLFQHPLLGPPLRAWEYERAVSSRSKFAAIALMSASWLVMFRLTSGPLVPALTGLLFCAVAIFLLSRPAPGAAPPPPQNSARKTP